MAGIPVKTDVNYTTYGDEMLHIWELSTQKVNGVDISPISNTGDVSWTSRTSGITYSTASSSDPTINGKGNVGLLRWLNSLFKLSVGDSGYGNCLIDSEFFADITDAIVSSSAIYGEDASSSDTYAISLPNSPSTLSNGFVCHFKAHTQNTNACSININGTGAVPIKYGNGADLITGAIAANDLVSIMFNGSYFILMSACPAPYISKIYNTGTLTLPSSDDTLVGRDTTDTLTNKTLTSPIITTPTIRDWTGWQDANETWSYSSASSITVAADVTSKYQIGDRLKCTQTSVKYFRITNISYSAPNTVITVVGIYGEVVADATISANYYSKAYSPQGVYPVGNDGWIYDGMIWTQYSETKGDADISTGTNAVVTTVDVQTGVPVGWTIAAPTGLSINTIYYAIRVDATHIKFATSLVNAYAGTNVSITAVGTGSRVLNILDRIIITGDVRSKYQKGYKIKYTNSSLKYNYIIADPVLSGSNTILQMSGLAYVSTASPPDTIPTLLGTAITNNFYSMVESPIGFPDWFSYTPKYSASGSMTYTGITTNYAKFKIVGKMIYVNVNAIGTLGGSASDTMYATLPLTSAAGANVLFGTAGINITPNLGQVSIANNLASIMRYDVSNFVTGAGRYAVFSVFYEY